MKRTLLALLLLSGCATSGYGNLSQPQQGDVRRVQAYLNTLKGLKATFVQNGPDDGQSAGHFAYIPGHLRLDYVSPHPMQLVAGEGHLVLTDQGSGAVTQLSLKRNPLGLLLRYPVRFDEGVQVTDVRHGPDSVQVSVAQADNPSQGLLTLQFSDIAGRLELVGLQGVDARQHHFGVSLSEISENSSTDPDIFKFPSE